MKPPSLSIAAFALSMRMVPAQVSMMVAGLAGFLAPAQAQDSQWRGAARAELRAFVQKQQGMLHLPWPIAFYGDFSGDGQDDAIVFVYREIKGAAGNFDLRVATFKGEEGKFKFLRYAPDVYGEQPRQPRFSAGLVEFTTTMPRPGDPRCCPTGSKRYSIKTETSSALETTVPSTTPMQPTSSAASAVDPSSGASRSEARPATALVRRAYSHLSIKGIPPDKPFFTAGFNALVQKDRRCEQKIGDQHYASAIWFSGQDWKISDLALSESGPTEQERHVTASFKNMNTPQARTFVLKRVGSDWRIDNVIVEGTDLRKVIREGRCSLN